MKFLRIWSATLVALFVFSGAAMAQCPSNSMPVNEIGIRLANVSNSSGFGGIQVDAQKASLGFLNGLHFKR